MAQLTIGHRWFKQWLYPFRMSLDGELMHIYNCLIFLKWSVKSRIMKVVPLLKKGPRFNKSCVFQYASRAHQICCVERANSPMHDDDIKWKHFPRYWSFVRKIHRLSVNSPHKGQWRGALMFSLICAWMNGWINNREAGDLRRHRVHHDVVIMVFCIMSERPIWSPHYMRSYLIVLCICDAEPSSNSSKYDTETVWDMLPPAKTDIHW